MIFHEGLSREIIGAAMHMAVPAIRRGDWWRGTFACHVERSRDIC
jgi:hypothetical protein